MEHGADFACGLLLHNISRSTSSHPETSPYRCKPGRPAITKSWPKTFGPELDINIVSPPGKNCPIPYRGISPREYTVHRKSSIRISTGRINIGSDCRSKTTSSTNYM